MRLVILGGTGMLGHTLWECLSRRFPDTYTTIRKGIRDYGDDRLFGSDRVIEHIDVMDFRLLEGALRVIKPDVILNCIGITKRREDPKNPITSIVLNAMLPHKLAKLAVDLKAKLIHFSTDCVFDGRTGHYSDDAPTNATDLYGRTKALGEFTGNNVLTLRSSFIGKELREGTELLEWFLSQKKAIRGFKNAIYTGLTTLEICRVIEKLLLHYPDASGLYNVSSEPINKFDLLKLIGEKMHRSVEIIPDESFHCDRSVDSARFRRDFGYTPPTWTKMVEELSQEYRGES
ncbi:MAG: SDR family oxidoreductase [Deltaproteobacteria bacterium]|nr:SDR family oxidoreductase [Deltaproteobacteria bacterium]